jgi:AraC family transcriptional regulator
VLIKFLETFLILPYRSMQKNNRQSLFIDRATANTTASILPCSPILSSVKAGWENLFLEYHYQPSGEHDEVSAAGHSIAVFTKVEAGGLAERTLDGRVYKHSVRTGDIILVPALAGVKASWRGSSEFILLGFHPEIFPRLVDESIQAKPIPQMGISDPLILQMGLALKQVLENNLDSRLYVETMANALFVHLIQHYSTSKPVWQEYKKGLGQRKLQQVIDYIHTHLDRDLSLLELADFVGMSPHYFSLLFKQSTGLSPHQYVIKIRVDRAKQLLIQGKMSIADIAQTVGFANQSHLNLHFKRLVGVTPKQYSQKL